MKIQELLSENDFNRLSQDLEEGPIADKLKKGALGAAVLLGVVAGGAHEAKANQCVKNDQMNRIECYRADGQGVWSAIYDQQGRQLSHQQIEQNIQAAMQRLGPMRTSGYVNQPGYGQGQYSGGNYTPPGQNYQGFNYNNSQYYPTANVPRGGAFSGGSGNNLGNQILGNVLGAALQRTLSR